MEMKTEATKEGMQPHIKKKKKSMMIIIMNLVVNYVNNIQLQ